MITITASNTTNKKKGLFLKYFVLKPKSKILFDENKNKKIDPYAKASREAMRAYAIAILPYDGELAHHLKAWVEEEERNDRFEHETPF